MSDVQQVRAELMALGVERLERLEAVRENVQRLRPVVVRALEAGLTPGQVAELSAVNTATVRRWRAEARVADRS